jgi:L-fuconolactonase
MIKKIDAHQHFWRYDPIDYSWITEEMLSLKKDFLPDDLFPILEENGVEGTVAVQAFQDEKENDFLLDLAEKHPFILAVVGWIDLKSEELPMILSKYKSYKKLKGFRHVLQDEADPEYILNQAFQRGLKTIIGLGYTYDLLVLPHQIKGAIKTVSNFESGSFVLDHLAKPDIKNGQNEQWKENIKALAEYPNVHCKLSGMITEAAWNQWEEKDFYPYMDTVMEAFGEDRLMFGSDWPVCKLSGSYEQVVGLMEGYFKGHSESTLQKIWHTNAINFYQL